MKRPVSVCIITKNEEKKIGRCLSSFAGYGFELVIVDTGSTDRTKEIAAEYTDKIYDYKWIDDFSAARNFSLSKASNDWIFMIDSDEWMESIDTEEMSYFMRHLPNAAGSVTRINKVGSPDKPGQTSDHTERFFNRKVYHYEGIIHEQIRKKLGEKGDPLETYLMKITIGHDGYCLDDEERQRKADRNYTLLLRELEGEKDNPYIYYQLGKACDIRNDSKNAVKYYSKGLAFRPDPFLAYTEAMVISCGNDFIENGEYLLAASFSDYYDTLGDCADYCVMLGKAYLALNTRTTRKKARECFTRALSSKRESSQGAGSTIPRELLTLMNENPVSLCRENEKLISVIIPCYNASAFLPTCLDSIRNQTIGFEHLEVILVDDASTDSTWDVLRSFKEEAKENVIIIHCEKNERQGHARNLALEQASGEYVLYVDADDWIDSDMCRVMYNDAVINDSDIVCCCGLREGENGVSYVYPNLTAGENEDKRLLIDNDDKRRSFLLASSMGAVTCNKLILRDFLISNDISFPERLAYEDNYWYNILYLYAERVYIDGHRFYHYRINPDSTVQSKGQTYQDDLLKVNAMKWEMWQKRGFLQKYRNELEVDFLYSAYLGYFRILICRFDEARYDLFLKLKGFVTGYIPDYRKNPLIESNFSEFDRLVLEMLITAIGEKEFSDIEQCAIEYMYHDIKSGK